MLPNMAEDWRFSKQPCVAQSGLRSYAGAQLRCKAPTGESIPLGSLCVASSSQQPPLSDSQQTALVRFADLISADIVSHSREERRRQRIDMARLLAECRTDDPEDSEAHIMDLLHAVFPNTTIGIHESSDGTIPLPNHGLISILDVTDGLWEDSELIDELIITQNHHRLETSRTVRAIVYACQTYPVVKYLVVSSSKVQLVFDDVDAYFVEKCAGILTKIIHEASLRDALKAKDRFLRGITHQLRTPIHGILGSCDLLAEELPARSPEDSSEESATSPTSIINTIRDSGRELMSTVNNMLKLNRLIQHAEIGVSRKAFGLQTLNQIEADIMYEVQQAIPENELPNIPVLFDNQLASDDSLTAMDLSLLKECIQSLILNALAYTSQGAVVIVISTPPDQSCLEVDVLDTGCGIAPVDQTRIFEAFEKVDACSRGAGLGLTLAAKIAALLDGDLRLIASSQEPDIHGSHFRAEFQRPGFACPVARVPQLGTLLQNMPRTFYIVRAPDQRPELISHFANYLEHQGFTQVDKAEGSFVIVTYTPDTESFEKLIEALDPEQISICLAPAGSEHSSRYGHKVRFFTGPYLSARILEILKEVDQAYHLVISEASLAHATTFQAPKDDIYRISELEIHSPRAATDPVALLVDDNAVNLSILRMYCEKRKIPCTTAVNGEEAVDRFSAALQKGQPINLVFMDLQMPILDGVEATQQIRDIEQGRVPKLARSCIFMVTGQDSARDKARSFATGADEFYVKPTGIRTLDRGVSKYFPGFAETIPTLKPKVK